MGVTSWVFYVRVGFLRTSCNRLVCLFLKKTRLEIPIDPVAVDRFQSTVLFDNFSQKD